MNPKELYEKAITWQEKVKVIDFYHKMEVYRNDWNMRKTAKYFDVSLGLVCESIKLAANLEKVKHHKLRKDALKQLK
jgi:hypothetical protein